VAPIPSYKGEEEKVGNDMPICCTPGDRRPTVSQGKDEELQNQRRQKEPRVSQPQVGEVANASTPEVTEGEAKDHGPKERHHSTILRKSSTSLGSRTFPAMSCMILRASSLV